MGKRLSVFPEVQKTGKGTAVGKNSIVFTFLISLFPKSAGRDSKSSIWKTAQKLILYSQLRFFLQTSPRELRPIRDLNEWQARKFKVNQDTRESDKSGTNLKTANSAHVSRVCELPTSVS